MPSVFAVVWLHDPDLRHYELISRKHISRLRPSGERRSANFPAHIKRNSDTGKCDLHPQIPSTDNYYYYYYHHAYFQAKARS